MKTYQHALLLFCLVTIFGLTYSQSAESVHAQDGNLLQNPGFEEPYNNGLAQSWAPWHEEANVDADCTTTRMARKPSWGPELATQALIYQGSRSQVVGNQWATWNAGVFQNVPVTPGTTYQATAYAWTRASNDQYPAPGDPNVNFQVRVGIDPNGSGLWNDGDIVWGPTINPTGQWLQIPAVQATATGGQVTVFIQANPSGPGNCRAHIDSWFDAASLTAVTAAPPPTNTPAPPAPNPTLPPAPQPTATPVPAEPTATPVPPTATPIPTETPIPTGIICLNSFADDNANGVRDANEGFMAGVTLSVIQNNEILAQGVSTGSETPVCFSDLLPGVYQAAQQLPAMLEPTTASNIELGLEAGQTIGLEFGARIMQDNGTEPDVDDGAIDNGDNSAETGTADSGLSTITIVGIVLLTVAIFLLGAIVVLLLRR
ncbi:MAG: hypothetical protein M9918_07005 [Anaerolineae bacterium]|nr:hypothetical protein [Anaerolineae bacterium]